MCLINTVQYKRKFTPTSILLSSPLKSTRTRTASQVVSTRQSISRGE